MKKIRNLLTSLIIHIKLVYYSIKEKFEDDIIDVDLTVAPVERQQQRTKMLRGIRRMLVDKLRRMSPEDRTKPENLLGDGYKKTTQEKMAELRVQEKLLKNPNLKDEEDLSRIVVQRAPIYLKEEKARELRKAITAALRRSVQDPTNPSHQEEVLALRGKLKALREDIERMKYEV